MYQNKTFEVQKQGYCWLIGKSLFNYIFSWVNVCTKVQQSVIKRYLLYLIKDTLFNDYLLSVI